MNKVSLQKFNALFRNPTIQLVTVIIVGLLFIVILFITKIQPDFLEKTLLNQSISNLKQQRDVIAELPIPVKVDSEEIELLITQVPTDLEYSRLLLEFTSIERDAGVVIIDLTIGSQESGELKDELTDYILGKSLNEAPLESEDIPIDPESSSEEVDPGQEPIQPELEPTEPVLATPIEPVLLSLRVTGTYLEVTDFMERLYKMKRIVNIRNWALKPLEGEQYEIDFGLTVYTAPKYAGTFHELSEIDTRIPNRIGQPVMSDAQFKELLESQP